MKVNNLKQAGKLIKMKLLLELVIKKLQKGHNKEKSDKTEKTKSRENLQNNSKNLDG